VLSVDVEGWELEVLRGLDLARYRPKVLIIENMFHDQAYRDFARSHGYAFWRLSWPNDVYVATECLSSVEKASAACRYWLRRGAAVLRALARRRRS
jgi:hypothetical protein